MDPALWELLRNEAGADGDRVLEAIIRLARPEIEIPDIRLVSRFGTVATCRIRARDIVRVRARRDVVSLKAPHSLSPGFEPTVGAAGPDALDRADFRPTDVRRSPELALTGKDVVVASVDWGVDVDSAAFRWPADPAASDGGRPAGGTRFLSFWDQRDLAAGPRPDPYGYGTVHDREQIDSALRDPRPYERLGYHPAIADRGGHGTHGTHVLDIAAGNGQAGGPAGIAPDADLIFVHLADRTTGGLANLGDSVRLLEAVDFITRTAGSRPCVVNISAGRTCGPKDGTTLVERALDELLAATPGRFVVNSAGNYFGWRTHSCGRIGPGESRSLTFVIDPADITLNELEVWYDGADEFTVRIDPPGYAGGQAVCLGERSDLLIEGQAVGRVYHRKHDPNNGDNHIVAYIDPIAHAGNWTVTLEARKVTSGRFHAWIERDDTCRGCQARFIPADSSPFTTIGTITTSRLPLIVGAYDGHDPSRPVAPFSSSGPSRDLRPKPDLVAPGVDVLAARSASLIDSHNPGLLVRKSGTSMATPHVTGAVALCLGAAGNTLSAWQIRSLLLGSCDPARGLDAPHRYGRGYLNIPRLIADVQRALTVQSVKEPTMNTADSIAMLVAAPATAYREYLYRPHSQLARWIDERFDVVARPGQRLDQAPQLGDILLEVTPGRVRPGRCLVLKARDPEVEVSPRRLSAGQLLLRPRKRAEMSEPLPVEPAPETEGTNPEPGSGPETVVFPGGASLPVAAWNPKKGSEHWDPHGSGNPLLDASDRTARLSKSFTVAELARSGSTEFALARIDLRLVNCLQELRDYVGRKVRVTSGYRPYLYNMGVYRNRNQKPTESQHSSGRAADVKIKGMTGMQIAMAAIDACGPQLGLGIGTDYAHVDVRGVFARWSYSKDQSRADQDILEITAFQRARQRGSAPAQRPDPATVTPTVPGSGMAASAGAAPAAESDLPPLRNTPVEFDQQESIPLPQHDTEVGSFIWGDGTHGAELARDASFQTRQPLLGYASPNDAEFASPEHADIAKSVQMMIDQWALHGLVAGGVFIDTGAARTPGGRDGPIRDWKIVTPALLTANGDPPNPYPDTRGLAHAHWYYIAPDPLGPGAGWTPDTLRAALLTGDAVALSLGQILLLAGDLYESFDQLTGRDATGTGSYSPANLMRGLDSGEPWAHTILRAERFRNAVRMNTRM